MPRAKGEGSIRKIGDRFYGRITIDGQPISVSGATEGEVAKALMNVRKNKEKGLAGVASKTLLTDWLDTWMATYRKNKVKDSTYASYTGLIDGYMKPYFKNVRLRSLRRIHIQQFVNSLAEKELADRTVKYIFDVLKMSLTRARKEGMVTETLTDDIELPSKGKKKAGAVWSLAEQRVFLQAINSHRLKAAFYLDIFSGLRIGELTGIRREDVYLDDAIIRIAGTISRYYDPVKKKTVTKWVDTAKTDESIRSVFLTPDLVEILRTHMNSTQPRERLKAGCLYIDNGLLFQTQTGAIIHREDFRRAFNRVIDNAGLRRIRVHDIRHTFATTLLEADVDLKLVSELLGHTDTAITSKIYAHISDKKKRTGIDILEKAIKNEKTAKKTIKK